MNFKILYFFLILIAIIQTANAKTKSLLSMKTDDGKGFYYAFKINIDDNSGKLTDFVVDKKSVDGNTTVEHHTFNASSLASGIVILKKKGHNIVKLSSQDFDYFNGGTIKITYLKNALTKNHDSLTLELSNENGEWGFYSDRVDNTKRNSRKINELLFESEKVFIVGTVGIKNVICK